MFQNPCGFSFFLSSLLSGESPGKLRLLQGFGNRLVECWLGNNSTLPCLVSLTPLREAKPDEENEEEGDGFIFFQYIQFSPFWA